MTKRRVLSVIRILIASTMLAPVGISASDSRTRAGKGSERPGELRLCAEAVEAQDGGRVVPCQLAERGALRLLLADPCGRGGRRVVLQNRHGGELRARLQVSRWVNGALRSSWQDQHTLAAVAERGLGCTQTTEGVELRYQLTWVSDAAAEPVKVDSYHDKHHDFDHGDGMEARALRDWIETSEGGICGQGGAGHEIGLLNRHPGRDITVKVKYLTEVGGASRRTYTRTHRLRSGGDKDLGCSADGALTLMVSVVEVW